MQLGQTLDCMQTWDIRRAIQALRDIEGMKDAELIIAVNSDETAPIFEHAHYGTTEDLFDIVPVLAEKLG